MPENQELTPDQVRAFLWEIVARELYRELKKYDQWSCTANHLLEKFKTLLED